MLAFDVFKLLGQDFDQNYEPINANYPSATASSYTVRAGDTLASIAQTLWGDASMWYQLADANALKSTDTLSAGRVLTVPNKVTNIHNNANTFRPYNAGEMIGHVDPTLPASPPPPGKRCGGWGQILMVVVAVVATIYTAGAAAAYFGTAATAGGFAGGAAVLGGTAVGLSTTAMVGIAAGAAAVGSMASQLVGMATGDVKSFSWKAVGQSALAAGITAGVGSALSPAATSAGAATGAASANATAANTSWLSGTYAHAAVTAAASTGMNMVLHGTWSWRQMGASVVGSMVGAGASEVMGSAMNALGSAVSPQTSQFAQRLAGGFAGGWASSEVMAGNSNFSRADSSVLFASAMGNAIGQGIADGTDSQNSPQQSFRQSEIREQNAQADDLQRTSRDFARMDGASNRSTPYEEPFSGNGLQLGRGGYGAMPSWAALNDWGNEIDGGIMLNGSMAPNNDDLRSVPMAHTVNASRSANSGTSKAQMASTYFAYGGRAGSNAYGPPVQRLGNTESLATRSAVDSSGAGDLDSMINGNPGAGGNETLRQDFTRAANLAVGTAKLGASGVYNSGVRAVAGAASIPYLADSVAAAVAVQQGVRDVLGWTPGGTGVSMIAQSLAPAGQAVNSASTWIRGQSENYLGDGVTSLIGATGQFALEAGAIVTGGRAVQTFLDNSVSLSRSVAGGAFVNGIWQHDLVPLTNAEVYGAAFSRTPKAAIDILQSVGHDLDMLRQYSFVPLSDAAYAVRVGRLGQDFDASCGMVPRGTSSVTFDKNIASTLSDGSKQIPIYVRNSVLASDEAIVQVLSHEIYETQDLLYSAKRPLSITEYHNMVRPDRAGNLHYEAVKDGDY